MATAAAGAPPGAAVLHLPGPPSALGRPGPQLDVRAPGAGRSVVTAAVAAGVRLRSRQPGFEDLGVFAVDDCSVQVQWSASMTGPVRVGAGDRVAEVASSPPAWLARFGRHHVALSQLPGGPGTAVVDGLEPARSVEVWAETSSGRVSLGAVQTLPTPPGRLLGRIATLSDIHVGESHFGPEVHEDRWPLPSDGSYPLRSVVAAVDEAVAWGATHLVVKGDLTRDSEPGEFDAVGRLLAGLAIDTDVVLGNHDVRHGVDGVALLARHGIDASSTTRVRDLPGLRLVLAHTPTSKDHWGELSEGDVDRIGAAAGAAPGGCMVVAHHAPMTGLVTTHYPPGMRAAPSRALLRRLAEVNPASVVVAGHTHRNRVRWAQGIVCVETGSTKDHPGGWTGYRIFEGGIVQTARRTARPDVLAWTEATRHAVARQWGRWSPGVLADRCWSLDWPAR